MRLAGLFLFPLLFMQFSGDPILLQNSTQPIQLITLDPGHFHAALVQKEMYNGVDPTVQVYAPDGAEVAAYLQLINQYNTRADHPTKWKEEVYKGPDYFTRMLAEKKGNVVVLAGNNQQKTTYIMQSVKAGLHVLADKPMIIDNRSFSTLRAALQLAEKKQLMVYDIMTERSEITNILQRMLINTPALFGSLKQGSATDPSVVMESVHFYYKYVSGNVLRRPTWFFDPKQQGDAIADVGTHLIDLVQWQSFPEQVIQYKKDIAVETARLWPTPLSKKQFTLITGTSDFPKFLQSYVTDDTVLQTHGNGEVNYRIKDVHAKVIARWEYQAPTGSGDTHYSLYKGTKANIEIRQGEAEKYQPTVYVMPADGGATTGLDVSLKEAIASINQTYPGVTVEPDGTGFRLVIPKEYKVGHEAHFAQVMQRYLQYLKNGELPAWEVPNMLAKYYTSTKALQIATRQIDETKN